MIEPVKMRQHAEHSIRKDQISLAGYDDPKNVNKQNVSFKKSKGRQLKKESA